VFENVRFFAQIGL